MTLVSMPDQTSGLEWDSSVACSSRAGAGAALAVDSFAARLN